MKDPAFFEKLALLILAGLSIVSLTMIGMTVIRVGSLDANGAGLLGVVIGALAASAKDIVQAIRGYSMSAQLSKVTDQLAAAAPVPAPTDEPTEVTVVNPPSKPVPVKGGK